MKSIAIGLGGHPLTAQQTLWLQSGLTEGLMEFIRAFAGDFYIVSGLTFDYTGGNITWTDGWLFMNSEFLKVDAGTIVGTALQGTFQVVETYEAVGVLNYKDLTSHNTQLLRKATLVVGGGTGDTYWHNKAKRLKTYSTSAAAPYSGSWSGGVGNLSVNLDGSIRVFSNITVASWATPADDVAITLPVGLRPGGQRYVAAPAMVNSLPKTIVLEVNSNGTIKPLGLTAGQPCTILAGTLIPLAP